MCLFLVSSCPFPESLFSLHFCRSVEDLKDSDLFQGCFCLKGFLKKRIKQTLKVVGRINPLGPIEDGH